VVSRLPDEGTLQLVINSIRDYAIFQLDPDGNVASWNVGAELIKGYQADEIIGSSFTRFYTQEDRDAGRPHALLASARAHGRVEDEGWRVRKDGSRFWADVVISAIRNDRGETIGFSKVTRDLSERMQAEQARLQDAARFRTIIDSIRDYAIFALEKSGHVATWNPGAERIKGYTADEIIGKHFSVFYPAESVASGYCERELALALERGQFEDEGWRVRKDGSQFWANVLITPLYAPDGTHLGYSKVTRDLTERRKWEEDRLKLAQANEAVRLRDEFLFVASHELRTPLMALQLQLDMLLGQRDAFDEKLAVKLDRASRNAERLAELMATLLDVGRIASGSLSLSRDEVDLSSLVADSIERLTESAQAAKCEMVAEIEPGIIGRWDSLRISQVITNLLANAYKYAGGYRVYVTVRRDGDTAVVTVRDHGPGIAPEHRVRIFDRFERAASPTLGGLGLGLYVAHQIVSAHGGTIGVTGADGGGARFEIRLPLNKPEDGT
jgi:PAS domain S-box-containing protein